VPVKDDNGKWFIRKVTKTFTDHGKLIVNYSTYVVKEPVFNGYSQYLMLDYDEECYYDTEYGRCGVRRYWINFYPKVDYKVIYRYLTSATS
jgi:hypothetical protein